MVESQNSSNPFHSQVLKSELDDHGEEKIEFQSRGVAFEYLI